MDDNNIKYVDSTKTDSPQRIISMCTGYRGIEIGLEMAGLQFETACYVEIEAFCIANLVAAMEKNYLGAVPIWTNLKTFPSEYFCNRIHGLIAGYPCQPFSAAGRRQGTKDPRHLWPYIREHIRTIRPVWCFFENVEGHLSMGFSEVYKDLRNLGYKVEAGLFSAQEVGLSHQRKRLFILAVANTESARSRRQPGRKASRFTQSFCNSSNGEREVSELADTNGSRSGQDLKQSKLRASRVIESSGYSRSGKTPQGPQITQGVARPGQEQHEWEYPRQSSKEEFMSLLGLPIDGYGFRTDFLRALGNGVVPQTACKAWIELNKLMCGDSRKGKAVDR